MADIPADIILYALVAAGLIFWLRSVLGTRHGDERQRPNPFVSSGEHKAEEATAASRSPLNDQDEVIEQESYDPFSDKEIIPDESVQQRLLELRKSEPDFDPQAFASNAEEAFIMIVQAFARGERDTLRELLSADVYDAFENEITDREKRGETTTTEVQAIRNTQITDCRLDGGMAFITLKVHAEETCVISDEEGNTISGNANRPTEVIDLWTFGKKLRSRDPVWYLYKTDTGEHVEEHKTPLPEATDKRL